MTDLLVRRYEPADADAVHRLNERALDQAGTDSADIPDIDDLDRIRAVYLETGGEFLVAERDGILVGMGGLQIDDGTAELLRMRVDPAHQRDGIGTALLERLLVTARERGADRLVAETAARQRSATQFYPAHGFDVQSRRSLDEYDLIRYEKSL